MDSEYDDIDSATMARLIYLATYLDYDGRLVRNRNKEQITLNDLGKVMNLSNTTTWDFLKRVSGKYVEVDEDGKLSMNRDFFMKGKISPCVDRFQQFYIMSVRDLYHRTNSRRHKMLGNVFRLLQYVNIEYNAICHNPLEAELDKIQFLTLNEFCEAVGFDTDDRHRHRLVNTYKKIRFVIDGKEEVFCSFVTSGADLDTAKIYINPNVLYKGHRWDEVKILGKFSEIVEPKKKKGGKKALKRGGQKALNAPKSKYSLELGTSSREKARA